MGFLNDVLKRYFKTGYSITQSCSSYSSEEYMLNIYNNPSFTQAIKKRSQALKSLEWGVVEKGKDGFKENHKLSDLFIMPNKVNTWGEFLEYWTVWYNGSDNGVLLEKVATTSFSKPELKIHNPSNFNIYMSGDVITRIEINNPSRHITNSNDLENFMWIKQPNWNQDNTISDAQSMVQSGRSPQRGMSLLGTFLYNAWRWNNSIVKNLGKRTGVYKTDRPISEKEAEKVHDEINSKNTLDDKGKSLFVSGGLDFNATDSTPEEADWSSGESKAHDRIVSSLGVAPELTGSGNSTFENRKQASKELYHTESIPEASQIAMRLTMFLRPWLNDNEFISFNTSKVYALKTDIKEAVQSLEGAKNRLTIDEYRKMFSKLTGEQLEDISNVLLVSAADVSLDDVLLEEKEPQEDVE